MGMPWSLDFSPERAHCWLSDAFSVRTESLCLDRPESPNSDYVCCAAKGHKGRHDHRWTGNDWPQFRAVSVRDALRTAASKANTAAEARALLSSGEAG